MKYPSSLQRSWGFLLKDVSRLHVKRFEQRAQRLGLSLPECRALLYLSHEEGATQVRLAALTDIEPMTLVRMLDRMEADGWLERRNDPTDRRIRCLYFKPQGQNLLAEIDQMVRLTYEEAVAGIPKKNLDLFMTLLENTHKNLLTLKPITADAVPRRVTSRRKVSV